MFFSSISGDATVTITHRYTPKEQLKIHTQLADIVIVAAGNSGSCSYPSCSISDLKRGLHSLWPWLFHVPLNHQCWCSLRVLQWVGFLTEGRASDWALCSCPSHLQTHKLFLVTCDTFPLGRLQSELKIGNQSVHSLYRCNYVN